MIAKKWFAALGFVVAVLVIAVIAQTTRPVGSRGWEFAEVELSATQTATPTLNKYGAEGWELVNVVSGCITGGNNTTGISTSCRWYAYFKRQK